VSKRVVRKSGLHLFDFVAADETDIGQAVLGEGIDGPVDETLAGNFGKALGGVGRGGHEAAAAAGANHNDSHSFIPIVPTCTTGSRSIGGQASRLPYGDSHRSPFFHQRVAMSTAPAKA